MATFSAVISPQMSGSCRFYQALWHGKLWSLARRCLKNENFQGDERMQLERTGRSMTEPSPTRCRSAAAAAFSCLAVASTTWSSGSVDWSKASPADRAETSPGEVAALSIEEVELLLCAISADPLQARGNNCSCETLLL